MFKKLFSSLRGGVPKASNRVLVNSIAALLSCQAAAAQPDIVFLGDDARVEVVRQCGNPCQTGALAVGTPGIGSKASDVASYVQKAKHVVVVMDATQGPLPIIREHILIARQAAVPDLSILIVNTSRLEGGADSTELLELEELDVRETMNTYGLPGDHVMVFHDARISSAPDLYSNGIGLQAVLRKAAMAPIRRDSLEKFSSGRRLSAEAYLLTPQESSQSRPMKKGDKVELWVNGQLATGAVRSEGRLAPGDSGALTIELAKSVTAAKGSRFLLEREGTVIAVGMVVQIE